MRDGRTEPFVIAPCLHCKLQRSPLRPPQPFTAFLRPSRHSTNTGVPLTGSQAFQAGVPRENVPIAAMEAQKVSRSAPWLPAARLRPQVSPSRGTPGGQASNARWPPRPPPPTLVPATLQRLRTPLEPPRAEAAKSPKAELRRWATGPGAPEEVPSAAPAPQTGRLGARLPPPPPACPGALLPPCPKPKLLRAAPALPQQ